ncbi:type II secretion system F family protein [Mariniluteicoccus endophyticus]
MNAAYAAICGMVLCLGVVAVVRGFVGGPPPVSRTRTRSRVLRGVAARQRNRRLAAGLVIGVVVAASTGWFVALLLGPVIVVGVPYLWGTPTNREVELLAALDRWVRSITAILPTGRSVADAIRASARTVPSVLADDVVLLVARLDERWSTRDALRAMADRLDSPDSDAVVAALMLAAHRGGTGATASLNALSEAIADRLHALREIEAERAKPRVVVRQVTLVSAVLLVGCVLLGGDFFAPYRSGPGQVILAGLGAAYVASLVMMRRIATPPPRQRVLRTEVTA